MIMIINFSLETFSEWKYVIRDFLLFRQNGCRFQKLNRTLEIIVNVGKKLDRKKKRGKGNMVCRWFNTATQLASFLWRHGHPPCANTTESVRKGGDYRRWPAGMSGTPVGKTCNGSFVRTKPTGIVRSRLPWQRTTKEKEKKTVDQCGFYYAFSPHILNISYKKNILERTRPKPSINFGQRGKRCRSIWRKTQYLVLKAAVNYNWQHITNYYYIVTRWQYRPRSDWQTRLWSRLSHFN